MDNNKLDQMHGALGEINRQITLLQERKAELLALCGEAASSAYEEHKLPNKTYSNYLEMIANRREPIINPRIVYQGEPGAFSEMAAIDFFGPDVDTKGLYQFEDTFEALKKGEADYAVLPIENSSTGAIRQVYDLLAQYNYFFVGETTVQVNQSLLALPSASLDDIETVYSHEQGLFQCEEFLKSYPSWKKIPQADTAGSAKIVAELQDPSKAAICSPRAAQIYGLQVLKENISSNKNNTTRFVVVSPYAELRQNRDKICISLTTEHESGSLHDILTVFAVNSVNLVRLESRPIQGEKWKYMFFIEFNGNLSDPAMDDIIHEIALMSGDLRVLGNFESNLSD